MNNGLDREQTQQTKAIDGAVKYDTGKPPVARGAVHYFPRAITGVAAVSAFGATKYAWNGWLHVPDGVDRYSDAMVRHMLEEAKGNVLDDDSGLPHYLHTCWNALAVAELKLLQAPV
jgi:hypothetical protein